VQVVSPCEGVVSEPLHRAAVMHEEIDFDPVFVNEQLRALGVYEAATAFKVMDVARC
jgi:hypothetical protein